MKTYKDFVLEQATKLRKDYHDQLLSIFDIRDQKRKEIALRKFGIEISKDVLPAQLKKYVSALINDWFDDESRRPTTESKLLKEFPR